MASPFDRLRQIFANTATRQEVPDHSQEDVREAIRAGLFLRPVHVGTITAKRKERGAARRGNRYLARRAARNRSDLTDPSGKVLRPIRSRQSSSTLGAPTGGQPLPTLGI